jgi:serine/threonine protein kinase
LSGWPQSRQNAKAASFSRPHRAHFTVFAMARPFNPGSVGAVNAGRDRDSVEPCKMPAMSVCSECHKEFADTSRFCPFCGSVATAAAAVDPYIGTLVAGKFRIEKLLGQGGMGKVYLANHQVLEQKVVLKVLLPDTVKRFQHEGRAASRLRHPNVIQVLDFGAMEDGTLFMAMEYLPGRDLAHLIQTEFPLGDRRIVRIGAQILAALSEAHAQNIIHRDLKPENVMIEQRRGESDFVKVLDFGIAKITDAKTKLTAAGLVCGTPEYMSPEQAKGADLDPRSDLYSVGVILYQMVTGLLPFESDTPVGFLMKHLTDTPMPPSQKQPEVEVPPELEALIMRALAKNPADRFANAEEMRAELIACVPGDASASPRTASAPSIAAPATPARSTGKSAPAPTKAKAARTEEAETPPAKSGGKMGMVAAAAAVLVIGGAAGAYFATRGGGTAPAVAQTPAQVVQPPSAPPVPAVPAQPAVAQPPVQPVAQPPVAVQPPTPVEPAQPPPDKGGRGGRGKDRRVARIDPAEARDLMKQGDGLRAQQDCGAAIPLYLQAEAADPKLTEVHKKLAICYQSLGETKKAVRRYERYLSSDPADAEKVKLILSTLR